MADTVRLTEQERLRHGVRADHNPAAQIVYSLTDVELLITARLSAVEAERDDWRETALTMSDDYHRELTQRIEAEAERDRLRETVARVEALVTPYAGGGNLHAYCINPLHLRAALDTP